MAERIEMPLGMEVDVGPVTKNKKGFPDPAREGGKSPPPPKKNRLYGVPSKLCGRGCLALCLGIVLSAISSRAVSYLCGQLSSCFTWWPPTIGDAVPKFLGGTKTAVRSQVL